MRTLLTNLLLTQPLTKVDCSKQPLQTYSSLAFSYEEDGDYGKSINTHGSIPAETYTQTLGAQRSVLTMLR